MRKREFYGFVTKNNGPLSLIEKLKPSQTYPSAYRVDYEDYYTSEQAFFNFSNGNWEVFVESYFCDRFLDLKGFICDVSQLRTWLPRCNTSFSYLLQEHNKREGWLHITKHKGAVESTKNRLIILGDDSFVLKQRTIIADLLASKLASTFDLQLKKSMCDTCYLLDPSKNLYNWLAFFVNDQTSLSELELLYSNHKPPVSLDEFIFKITGCMEALGLNKRIDL